MKTILKLAGWLVGAHLLLGGVLLVGMVQWITLAAVIGGGCRAIAGRMDPTDRQREGSPPSGNRVE